MTNAEHMPGGDREELARLRAENAGIKQRLSRAVNAGDIARMFADQNEEKAMRLERELETIKGQTK